MYKWTKGKCMYALLSMILISSKETYKNVAVIDNVFYLNLHWMRVNFNIIKGLISNWCIVKLVLGYTEFHNNSLYYHSKMSFIPIVLEKSVAKQCWISRLSRFIRFWLKWIEFLIWGWISENQRKMKYWDKQNWNQLQIVVCDQSMGFVFCLDLHR